MRRYVEVSFKRGEQLDERRYTYASKIAGLKIGDAVEVATGVGYVVGFRYDSELYDVKYIISKIEDIDEYNWKQMEKKAMQERYEEIQRFLENGRKFLDDMDTLQRLNEAGVITFDDYDMYEMELTRYYRDYAD